MFWKKSSGAENFAPNISLAPVHQQKDKKNDEKDVSVETTQSENMELNVSTDAGHVSDNSDSGVLKKKKYKNYIC